MRGKLHCPDVCLQITTPRPEVYAYALHPLDLASTTDTWSGGGDGQCIFTLRKVPRGGLLHHYSSALPDDFVRHTDASFWEAVDKVAARKPLETKSQFEVTQQVHGIRYEPCGLVCDLELRPWYRPISSTSWDWMHCFVASAGIIQYHANEFCHSITEHGIPLATLDVHLEAFLRQNSSCIRPLQNDFFSTRVSTPVIIMGT